MFISLLRIWSKESQVSKNTWCLLFWIWVSSRNIVFSKSVDLPENVIFSLYKVCMYYSFIINSSAERHLGHFQFLAIMNRVSMNLTEKVLCGV